MQSGVTKLVSLVAGIVVTLAACTYLFQHFHGTRIKPVQPAAGQTGVWSPPLPESQDAAKLVAVTGPLAEYVQKKKSSSDNSPEGTAQSETSATSTSATQWKPTAKDLIVASPVGTGGPILHKTFAVSNTVNFKFEIPAHVTNPQLHGSYQSYLRKQEVGPEDDSGNVEFLLLNAEQYADFLKGRPADVLLFVESSHSQQVNFDLAPTFNQPAEYCLVFRNRSGGATKKVVQAEFSVDF